MTPEEQRQHIEERVATPVRTVVGVTVRGLLMSLQDVPPEVAANMIAWQLGHHLGEAFEGDIGTLLTLRRSFKEQFEQGLASAKMSMPSAKVSG